MWHFFHAIPRIAIFPPEKKCHGKTNRDEDAEIHVLQSPSCYLKEKYFKQPKNLDNSSENYKTLKKKTTKKKQTLSNMATPKIGTKLPFHKGGTGKDVEPKSHNLSPSRKKNRRLRCDSWCVLPFHTVLGMLRMFFRINPGNFEVFLLVPSLKLTVRPKKWWFPIGISKLPGVYFQGLCLC